MPHVSCSLAGKRGDCAFRLVESGAAMPGILPIMRTFFCFCQSHINRLLSPPGPFCAGLRKIDRRD